MLTLGAVLIGCQLVIILPPVCGDLFLAIMPDCRAPPCSRAYLVRVGLVAGICDAVERMSVIISVTFHDLQTFGYRGEERALADEHIGQCIKAILRQMAKCAEVFSYQPSVSRNIPIAAAEQNFPAAECFQKCQLALALVIGETRSLRRLLLRGLNAGQSQRCCLPECFDLIVHFP